MYYDLLEIPKVVSRDGYLLDKLEYSLANDIIKRDDEYLLFKKELFSEKPFYYNIFDLSQKIKKDYPDSLYIIMEKDKINNFLVTIGNTIDINNASYYAKHKILTSDIVENKSSIFDIIKISTQMLNVTKIVIFHIGISREDSHLILERQGFDFSYIFDKNVDRYFYYLGVKEKLLSKVMPFILSFAAIFILGTISGLIADSIAEKKIAKQQIEITNIKNEILGQTSIINKLKKENLEIEKFSKKDLKIFIKEGLK